MNCDPNSDGMHHNGKPTVGTIYECLDDPQTTNRAQTIDNVLGG